MELEKLGLPGEGKFQSPIRRGSRCNEMQNVNINAVLSVSVPYLSGQALQWHKTGVNSTFYPIFVSTFCQDARQLTALPAGNTGFCDSISVTTREPHA